MPTASYRFPSLNLRPPPMQGGGITIGDRPLDVLPQKPAYPGGPVIPSPQPTQPGMRGRFMPPSQQVQMPAPWPSPDIQKRQPYSDSAGGTAATATAEPVQITPFMENIYTSMQNIDPEQRADYLQNSMAKIKERLDRYEFRIARGLPLTPEQQQQYGSMKRSFNDIQNYINDPQAYEDYFAKRYEETHRKRIIPEVIDRRAQDTARRKQWQQQGNYV